MYIPIIKKTTIGSKMLSEIAVHLKFDARFLVDSKLFAGEKKMK